MKEVLMEIREYKGYKAFNKNHTNRHNKLFEEGKIYTTEENIKFGVSSEHGYHFCKRLEDTLRYFPAMEEEIAVAEVTGLGEVVEWEDTYYDYYDMYSTSKIRIDRFLKREEIISMFLKGNKTVEQVKRFLMSMKLNEVEIELFKEAYPNNQDILGTIAYYQEGDKDYYKKVYQKTIERS